MRSTASWSFSPVGEAVWGFVDRALDPATYDQWLKNYAAREVVTNPAGYLIDAVVWLARQAVGLAGPVLLKLQAAIRCVREWVRTLFARCKIEVLLALWQVKIFLKSLEYQDAGTDLAAWAVMHLQFDSGPLMATVDALIHYVCPLEFPGVPEAIEAFLFGVITRERYECILRLNGVDPDSHEAFLYARSERLGPKETIQWVAATAAHPEEEDDALRRTGFYDGSKQQSSASFTTNCRPSATTLSGCGRTCSTRLRPGLSPPGRVRRQKDTEDARLSGMGEPPGHASLCQLLGSASATTFAPSG
jgi:hypothetical protein